MIGVVAGELAVFYMYCVLMVFGGLFGGVMNFFIECEDAFYDLDNEKWYFLSKSVVLGIGAAFLVPLFLSMIRSDLIDFKKVDYSSYLQFFGFCLIASITSSKFIDSMSSKLMQSFKISQKKVEEQLSRKDEEARKNSFALSTVATVLDDDAEEEELPNSELIEKAIQGASPEVKDSIFRQTRRYRIKHSKAGNELVKRCVSIFESLIKTDEGAEFHRYRAQLAYTLMSISSDKIREAISNLEEAISIRDSKSNDSFKNYELYLAVCYIRMDEKYKKGEASISESRNRIFSYVKRAVSSDKVESIVSSCLKKEFGSVQDQFQLDAMQVLSKWFSINSIDSINFERAQSI
ncbi:MAG: hypothetical protein EP322_08600 [Bacteroidetes bacterium]|nr:MAG: hypothetical protein EP322_08600 [Bacteroidota bacterium]